MKKRFLYTCWNRANLPDLQCGMCLDPLAEEYTGLSPYNYVSNNPLIFINPNGMAMDNYDTYENGKIKVERTDDKSDTFTYHDKKGNSKQ